jgi:hypothetical protein
MRMSSLALNYCSDRLAQDVHLIKSKMENLRSLRTRVAQAELEAAYVTVTTMSSAEWNWPSEPEVAELPSLPKLRSKPSRLSPAAGPSFGRPVRISVFWHDGWGIARSLHFGSNAENPQPPVKQRFLL